MIILVRHGEVDYSESKDPPLTKRGKEQVKALAERFRDTAISRIYSSDLIRAKETAKEIRGYHELRIQETKDLREISRYFRDGLEDEFMRIDKLLNTLPNDEKTVVVCHGHIIRYIIGRVLECPFEKMQKVGIFPASVSIVKPKTIITVNSYYHIPKEVRTKKEIHPPA